MRRNDKKGCICQRIGCFYLKNKCIRSIADLLQDQFELALICLEKVVGETTPFENFTTLRNIGMLVEEELARETPPNTATLRRVTIRIGIRKAMTP